MRPESEYRAALELIEDGLNDSEIGRRLGIPRGTIRSWRVTGRSRPSGRCPLCHSEPVDAEAYAYLLGAYLGDGWIWETHRGVHQLRVTCDLKYPEIINEVAANMVIVRGKEPVGFALREGCVDVNAYWKHWPCVFPQHGPGRKHEREIALSPWQQAFVELHPKAIIRGLIHSDGNRHINAITRQLKSGSRRYEYPRYMFKNASDNILGIFTNALDMLGIGWTSSYPRVVSVARREDVSTLDTFVGPKR